MGLLGSEGSKYGVELMHAPFVRQAELCTQLGLVSVGVSSWNSRCAQSRQSASVPDRPTLIVGAAPNSLFCHGAQHWVEELAMPTAPPEGASGSSQMSMVILPLEPSRSRADQTLLSRCCNSMWRN